MKNLNEPEGTGLTPERLSTRQTSERLTGLGLPRSVRSVSNDTKAPGCPITVIGGVTRVLWPAYLPWWVARQVEQAVAAVASPDLVDEQTKLVASKRRLSEAREAREAGLVVSIEETEKAVGDLLGALRAQLLATPTRESHRIVGLRSLAEATAALDAIIYDLMTSLSRRGPELAEDPGRR
ncbi:MAG: hypothetical protein EXR94_13035 [Gemmatimonadetes bacterium]|nr:hypothetical protein [Gemmatimonadota bacterium]